MYAILQRIKGCTGPYKPIAANKRFHRPDKAHQYISRRIRALKYPSPYQYVISNGEFSQEVKVV